MKPGVLQTPGCGEARYSTTDYDHRNLRPSVGGYFNANSVTDAMTKDVRLAHDLACW